MAVGTFFPLLPFLFIDYMYTGYSIPPVFLLAGGRKPIKEAVTGTNQWGFNKQQLKRSLVYEVPAQSFSLIFKGTELQIPACTADREENDGRDYKIICRPGPRLLVSWIPL